MDKTAMTKFRELAEELAGQVSDDVANVLSTAEEYRAGLDIVKKAIVERLEDDIAISIASSEEEAEEEEDAGREVLDELDPEEEE